jgi:deoxycytidine triphosphate deaminase
MGEASLDVRLGNQFIVYRTHRFGIFDAIGTSAVPFQPRRIQERQIITFGENLVLHPGLLVLASTFEYVSIPGDLECQVEGRSSWSRLGLQVATANSIEPVFKGVITLELSNVGTVPLQLMPGIRIAQLIFRKVEPSIESPYSGDDHKYRCPIGPEYSRLQEDYDWQAFTKKDNAF